MEQNLKSMMIISSSLSATPTFKMIPITNDCPYVEVILNPTIPAIAVIGKNKYSNPVMLPKLSSNGFPVQVKGAPKEGETKPQILEAQERTMVEVFYEYYITDKKEMFEFIDMFAVNPKHHLVKELLVEPIINDIPLDQQKKPTKEVKLKKA